MASVDDLPYLIHLLDDDDPVVRPAVQNQLAKYEGDLSHDLAALGIELGKSRKAQLARMLADGRRDRLREEWVMPSQGVAALEDDWESVEHYYGLIADFLHDGVTLRPSLSDALDELSEEIKEQLSVPNADKLCRWMFAGSKFRGADRKADAVRFFDLGGVIQQRRGNPTSLVCLLLLVARRVGAQVECCNYPGHCLAQIVSGGEAYAVDCFHQGRRFKIAQLLASQPEISTRAKQALKQIAGPGELLKRYLHELGVSLYACKREKDATLIRDLIITLNP